VRVHVCLYVVLADEMSWSDSVLPIHSQLLCGVKFASSTCESELALNPSSRLFSFQLHNGIPGSVFHVLRTEDGHDGFLLEQDLVGQHISEFLKHDGR
jgi:hypothetical protein